MKTPSPTLLCASLFSVLSLLSTTTYASTLDSSLEDAFKLGQEGKYGQVKLDLRYRYENVHLDSSVKKDASANTLRLRLGYLTPEIYKFQSYVEYEANLAMQENFNSLRNQNTAYETVADPEAQELNQAWLSYKGIPNTLIKGGRQRIILDNARFLGNVGWRQMEQTYDAVLLTNNSIKNLSFNAAFIGAVQTVKSQNKSVDMPLLNASYKFGKFSTFTGYAYWLADLEDNSKSTQTYGLRIHGKPKLRNNISLLYDIGYSHQASYANNPGSYDVGRYSLLLGATYAGLTLKSGIEQLDGNGTNRFQTPLGTNHGYQGWADKFLNTPLNGVRDIQASIDKTFLGTKFMFVYHAFTDAKGQGEYGDEYDFLITKKFGKHYQLLAKYAFYDADNTQASRDAGINQDTQKLWIQGGINF